MPYRITLPQARRRAVQFWGTAPYIERSPVPCAGCGHVYAVHGIESGPCRIVECGCQTFRVPDPATLEE